MQHVTHLQVFHIWEASGNTSEAVVVQMQLSQSGEVGKTAILYVTDMVKAEAQPGKSETRGETWNGQKLGHCMVHLP